MSGDASRAEPMISDRSLFVVVGVSTDGKLCIFKGELAELYLSMFGCCLEVFFISKD